MEDIVVHRDGRPAERLGQWKAGTSFHRILTDCAGTFPSAKGGQLFDDDTGREVYTDPVPSGRYTFRGSEVVIVRIDAGQGVESYRVKDQKELRQLLKKLAATFLRDSSGLLMQELELLSPTAIYTTKTVAPEAKKVLIYDDRTGNRETFLQHTITLAEERVVVDVFGGLQLIETSPDGQLVPVTGQTAFGWESLIDRASYVALGKQGVPAQITSLKESARRNACQAWQRQGFKNPLTAAQEQAASNFAVHLLRKSHDQVEPLPFTGPVRYNSSDFCRLDGGIITQDAGNVCAVIASVKTRAMASDVLELAGQLDKIRDGAVTKNIPELQPYRDAKLYGEKGDCPWRMRM
ncbi:hypothetical protein WJX73_004550 [Symbiochloris irregularis]|uniref:Uncharacterized protein n=1 Tax=Symbiochloris irregularis TaxID=706552 RepID=A0AAW1NZ25_9CHLO